MCLLSADAGAANAERDHDHLAKPLAGQSPGRATNSDHDLDHVKLASLSPGRLDIDRPTVQISCGLHHTRT